MNTDFQTVIAAPDAERRDHFWVLPRAFARSLWNDQMGSGGNASRHDLCSDQWTIWSVSAAIAKLREDIKQLELLGVAPIQSAPSNAIQAPSI